MNASPASAESSEPYVENLRRERDRFVALAFCAADILLEAGPDHRITYAAGATMALVGAAPGKLVGRPLLDIVDEDDRPLLRELIGGMTSGRRLEPVSVRFTGPNGRTLRFPLSGYTLPDLPESMFFALRLATGPDAERDADASGRDPKTGLYQTGTFVKRAVERLKTAEADGEDVALTMIRLQDFAKLYARLEPGAGEMLEKTIAACLRVHAASGEAVGRFDDDNYGIVHKPGLDIDELKTRIGGHIREVDPDGVGVAVEAATVDTELSQVSEADMVKAMHYSISRFCEEENAEAAISALSGNLQSHVAETSRKMSNFREIVSTADFDVVFQPIVEITTGKTSHFEALARFGGGSDRSPYELITFAENTGLICEFDFAMCRKLLDLLDRTNRAGQRYNIAVNLSGRSVANDSFLASLQILLEEREPLRKQLIIEITESARIRDLEKANRFIQSLRGRGHVVCLDDFGAGAAALKYLQHLDVDVVKIDGQYIRGAMDGRKKRAFLKSIATLCNELGISTVAEMVEDKSIIDTLLECGIRYGQGYLFGRPSSDIGAFELRQTPFHGSAGHGSAGHGSAGHGSAGHGSAGPAGSLRAHVAGGRI